MESHQFVDPGRNKMPASFYSYIRSTKFYSIVRETKRHLSPKLKCHKAYKVKVNEQIGLEIGGPSEIFDRNGLFPIYSLAARIDNCNYSQNTLWEGKIVEGKTFSFDKNKQAGDQYVREATDLSGILSESYDFALSSHVIEHTANPLLALSEWIRVLKCNGYLVLIVPHKEGTFDHRRPTSTLDHLIQDFDKRQTEDDLTHLPEILNRHDLSRDPGAGDFQSFKQRSEQNPQNRCLHQHVFDTRLAVEMIDYCGLQIHAVETAQPFHICLIAEKINSSEQPKNQKFKDRDSDIYKRSKFATDRQ